MMAPVTPGQSRSTRIVLIILAGMTVLAAILTPEAVTIGRGERSSFVAGPGGTRILHDLAQRLGWNVERRIAALDSVAGARVTHVVIAPGEYLGAAEVHGLLENVRRGGGLVFTMDGGDQIADSIGVGLGRSARTLVGAQVGTCQRRETLRDRPVLVFPPNLEQIVWRRPPPSVPDTLMEATGRTRVPVVMGFRLGAGRVAIVGSSDLLSNDVIRVCEWNVDVAAARVLEFMRPPGVERPTMIFDEFHHGYGEHGGTLAAISSYFSHTGSGRFLAQLLLAGLLVILARAPRPVPPRDTERIVRRSPLEHADALGHAYADVRATRTAVTHLVSGMRRRIGRIAGVGDSATDEAFLAGAVARVPETAADVAVVQHALRDPVDIARMPVVGDALQKIEHRLLAQIRTLS